MSIPEKHHCRTRISFRFRSYEGSISQGPLHRECGLYLFHLTEAKASGKSDGCLRWEMIPVRERLELPFGFSTETTSISPAIFTRDQAFTVGVEYASRV